MSLKNQAEIEKELLTLLGWTEEEYRQHIFDQGWRFLRQQEGAYEAYFSAMKSSKQYWNWWKHKRAVRDQFFLSEELLAPMGTRADTVARYRKYCNRIFRQSKAYYDLDHSYSELFNKLDIPKQTI